VRWRYRRAPVVFCRPAFRCCSPFEHSPRSYIGGRFLCALFGTMSWVASLAVSVKTRQETCSPASWACVPADSGPCFPVQAPQVGTHINALGASIRLARLLLSRSNFIAAARASTSIRWCSMVRSVSGDSPSRGWRGKSSTRRLQIQQ